MLAVYHADCDGYAYGDSYADSNGDGYEHANAHGYRDPDTDSDSDRNTNGNTDCNRHGYRNRDANAYPERHRRRMHGFPRVLDAYRHRDADADAVAPPGTDTVRFPVFGVPTRKREYESSGRVFL